MENIIVDVLSKPLAKNKHRALTKTMDLEAFDYLRSRSVEGKLLDCL